MKEHPNLRQQRWEEWPWRWIDARACMCEIKGPMRRIRWWICPRVESIFLLPSLGWQVESSIAKRQGEQEEHTHPHPHPHCRIHMDRADTETHTHTNTQQMFWSLALAFFYRSFRLLGALGHSGKGYKIRWKMLPKCWPTRCSCACPSFTLLIAPVGCVAFTDSKSVSNPFALLPHLPKGPPGWVKFRPNRVQLFIIPAIITSYFAQIHLCAYLIQRCITLTCPLSLWLYSHLHHTNGRDLHGQWPF